MTDKQKYLITERNILGNKQIIINTKETEEEAFDIAKHDIRAYPPDCVIYIYKRIAVLSNQLVIDKED